MGRFSSLQIVLFVFVFLGDANKLCVFSSSNNSTRFMCNDGDKETLLKFQTSLTDPDGIFSSWKNSTDCCSWEGIGCDTKTGRVVKLDLRQKYMNLFNMSSCLVELKYLEYLDLSGNIFYNPRLHSNYFDLYGHIPEFLGLIERLTYLNLSYTQVQTFIPRQLGNLTNLEVLDLSYTYGIMDDLGWMSRLSSLKHLDISIIQLSGALNLWQELSVLPSLSVLGLSGCSLNDTHFSPPNINSTFLSSIQELSIGDNLITVPFPPLLKNMTSLRILDISGSDFETNKDGSSMCMNGSDLEILNMKNSGLNVYFPDWLVQINKITKLDLSHNMLHGHIPARIGNLLALQVLDLSNNKLNGTIPATIGNLLALTDLDVSFNQLSGDVPESIGQLSALKSMDLSSNLLQGEISAILFLNLTMLKVLSFGSNQISVNIIPNWVPSFQLTYLDIGSCKLIGNVLPQWLESQKELETLLVSNASISGPLPKWFQSSRLLKLDLSHNQISGPIPHNIDVAFPTLEFAQLSHNMFNGTIPSSFCKMESVQVLDLSENTLPGDIPNCWLWTSSLAIIRLSSNKLTGVIPSSFGNLQRLMRLHLNNNDLEGELPISLSKGYLRTLNVGENKLSGNVPKWIGTNISQLQILRLRNNMFDGHVPHQLCSLKNLQILDLASNNLNGTIPPCLGILTGMIRKPAFTGLVIFNGRTIVDLWEEEKIEVVIKAKDYEYTKTLRLVVNLDLSSNKLIGTIPNELSHLIELIGLNLSYNQLTGNIPKSIGDLKSLQSLDLSNNKLFGNIPAGMSDLTSLAYLNLSQNNLSGKIPSGNQLQTFQDASIYMGNPTLCGDPLPKRCPGDDEPFHDENTEEDDDDDDDDDKYDKLWFYMAITLGYATGLWVVIGTLMLKKKWRYAYFRFADESIDRIYVTIVINYARMKKKLLRLVS